LKLGTAKKTSLTLLKGMLKNASKNPLFTGGPVLP
jgi:hypothetical protein